MSIRPNVHAGELSSVLLVKQYLSASFNEPVFLPDEVREQPLVMIRQFFRDYHLCDLKQLHHRLGRVASANDILEPLERMALLDYLEAVDMLLEAIFVLQHQHIKTTSSRVKTKNSSATRIQKKRRAKGRTL